MSVKKTGSSATARGAASRATTSVPKSSKPKIEVSEKKKTSVEHKDGYKTVTEQRQKTTTITSGGPRPSKTTYDRKSLRKKTSGLKKTKTSVEGQTSVSRDESAKVSHSRGQGKSVDQLEKEMDGGTKLAEKTKSKEVKAQVKTGFKEDLAHTSIGTVSHEGNADATARAKLSGTFEATSKKLEIRGEAEVEARAGGNYALKFKSKEFTIQGEKLRVDFTLNLSAEAVAKAGGKVELAVGAGPPPKAIVKLGGEAFAGAKAGVELTGSLKWIKGDGKAVDLASATGGASVRAGIGASAGLEFGYSDGKIRFDAYAGVTLGIGASAKVKGEINAEAMKDFITKVGKEGVKDLMLQTARGAFESGLIGPDMARDLLVKWQNFPGQVLKKVAQDGVRIGKDLDETKNELKQEILDDIKKGKKVDGQEVIRRAKEKMAKKNVVFRVLSWGLPF